MTDTFHRLTDGQLELIAGTETTALMELVHDKALFGLLGVPVPPSWPPELNDEDSYTHFLAMLRADPEAARWGFHYIVDVRDGRTLLGCAGYVSPPDADGTVEIGYSLLAPYRRQGHTSHACRLLIGAAFRDGRVKAVIARTYPDLIASVGVLVKLGFRLVTQDAEGIVTYRLDRA